MKAIFFDFDGTLVNSAPGILMTMKQVFLKMNLPIPAEEAMRQTIGLPLNQSMQQLGNLNEEDTQRAASTYRELFPLYEANFVTLFPQVKETLTQLLEQGLRTAIVTSRDTPSLDLIMNRRDMNRYFEAHLTGADGFKPKPAPDMVLALLQRMNLKAEEVLVVGDTTFDIGMGNGAGCRTVAVTYGNHNRQQLFTAHPTFTIDRFEDLLPIVL